MADELLTEAYYWKIVDEICEPTYQTRMQRRFDDILDSDAYLIENRNSLWSCGNASIFF